MFVRVYMYVYFYGSVYMCICTYVYIRVFVRMCICTYVYIREFVRMSMCMCICTYVYTNTCSCTFEDTCTCMNLREQISPFDLEFLDVRKKFIFPRETFKLLSN